MKNNGINKQQDINPRMNPIFNLPVDIRPNPLAAKIVPINSSINKPQKEWASLPVKKISRFRLVLRFHQK